MESNTVGNGALLYKEMFTEAVPPSGPVRQNNNYKFKTKTKTPPEAHATGHNSLNKFYLYAHC